MPAYSRKLSKGVRWLFRSQYKNQKYNSKAIYLTKAEANKAEKDYLKRLDEEIRKPKSSMSLKELMIKRLDYVQEQKSKDYYKETKRYFQKLLDVMGDIPAVQTKKEIVHNLLMSESRRLKKLGRTNHKANALLRSLKALFNWGIKIYDLDMKNPCNLDFVKVDKNIKYIPTDDEIESVRKMLTKEQKLLFDFTAETGCRIMEAIRFKAEDVKGNNIILYTRKAKNSDLTPRVIPMPECIKGIKFTGRLFASWNAYPRFLEGKANGWNFHNLRHRRASIWANSGIPVFQIMNLLGHTNTTTTMGYLQKLGIPLVGGERFGKESTPF